MRYIVKGAGYLQITFNENEVEDLKEMIDSACLPQRRVFNDLKEYLDENFKTSR